jgi:membrane fusion protein, multidrug efflux system
MIQYLNKSTVFRNLLFTSVLASAMMSSCKSEDKPGQETEAAIAEAPATEVFELQKGRLSSSLQIPGELIPYQEVDLYAKENSFVKKLYVDIGSEVKEGQLLVTMEAPELNSQLAGAVSVVKSRESIYLASKANYERLVETSKTPGTISPNDLEQAEARKNADLARQRRQHSGR